MASIKELQEAVAQARADALAINEKATAENRDLTAEETAQWEKANDAFDNARAALEEANASQANAQARADKLAAMEAFSNTPSGRRTEQSSSTPKPKGGEAAAEEDPPKLPTKAMSKAFSKFFVNGIQGMLPAERAAMQVDVGIQGGTLVLPEQMVNQLIKFVDDQVYMRQISTVLPLTNADSVGIPSWDTDPADAAWTPEIGAYSEDSSARTGKRNLKPNKLTKGIKISRTLLRKSLFPADQLVMQRLGYKLGIASENGYLNGNGSDEPLGIFTASTGGISTGRDVSTDNTTTEIKADGLINAKFSLKAQYQGSPSTRWMFHRTAIRNIRKLKDGNGQYLWAAGLGGKPDTILEVPYLMSEFAPSTFTTGLYVGIIGDFRFYYIADSLALEFQRLDELYAGTGQVGFIATLESDGMPVLEEAFARVKLA